MTHAFMHLEDSAESESGEVESSDSRGAGVAVSGRGYGQLGSGSGMDSAEGRITAAGAAENAVSKFQAEAAKIQAQLDATAELMNEIRGMGNRDLYKRGGKAVDAAVSEARTRLTKTQFKAENLLERIDNGEAISVIAKRTKVLQGSSEKLVSKAKAVQKAVQAFQTNVEKYIADGRKKNAARLFDQAHPYASRAITVVDGLASAAGAIVTFATAGAGSVVAAPIIAAVKGATAGVKKGLIAKDARDGVTESLLHTGADSDMGEKASDLAGYALKGAGQVAEHFGAVGASAAIEHGGSALKALTSGDKVGKLAKKGGALVGKVHEGAGEALDKAGDLASQFSPQGFDRAREQAKKEDGRNLTAVGAARDMLQEFDPFADLGGQAKEEEEEEV